MVVDFVALRPVIKIKKYFFISLTGDSVKIMMMLFFTIFITDPTRSSERLLASGDDRCERPLGEIKKDILNLNFWNLFFKHLFV